MENHKVEDKKHCITCTIPKIYLLSRPLRDMLLNALEFTLICYSIKLKTPLALHLAKAGQPNESILTNPHTIV